MKNKKILLIILLWFFIINYFSFNSFYNNILWYKYYKNWDYEKSASYFQKAENIYWYYNYINSLYFSEQYEQAIKEYNILLESTTKKELLFRTNNNIWNSYYRLFKKEEYDINKQIDFLTNSLNYYKDALKIKFDEQTKANYDFVKSKLEKIEKEKEKQENKENQKWEWENQNNNSYSNNEKNNKQDKNQEWELWKEDLNWKEQNSNWWQEMSNWEDVTRESSRTQQNLTSEQEKALEEYQESLEQGQSDYSNHFNKIYRESNNDFFDSIFDDLFFNNNLLNDTEKKDW